MAVPRIRTGDVVSGRYAVENMLGSGGMGVVFAARHVTLGQRMALKLMHADALIDEQSVERFVREARAAARLKSAHAAKVLDVGIDQGTPFMVMEYLDGRDLDAVIQEHGPLSVGEAVAFVLQICEAIAEAHAVGIVHRDIKPKNMFLTTTADGRPLVKMLDFGLAKTSDESSDASLTSTTAIFGSPQYMSPEQARSSKKVDARSDIWSIGVSLYELLTGRLPFDAESPAEIVAQILTMPPPTPSTFAPNLPAELERAVMRCLEKDAGLRYESVVELAAALEPFDASGNGSTQRIHHVCELARRNTAEASIVVSPMMGLTDSTVRDLGDGLRSPRERTTVEIAGRRSPAPNRIGLRPVTAIAALLASVAFVAFVVTRERSSEPTAPEEVMPAVAVARGSAPAAVVPSAETPPVIATSSALPAVELSPGDASAPRAKPVSPPHAAHPPAPGARTPPTSRDPGERM